MTASVGDAIFRWETLLELEPDVLQYEKPVPGRRCSIQLQSGATIRVWRADDRQTYFCHGLTFGGKEAPGGALSPYTGAHVETILREHYQRISEAQCVNGDILVWKGLAPESTPHSAILTDVVLDGGFLDLTTVLQTKNGMAPEEAWTLERICGRYGQSFDVFRRKQV